MLIVVYELRKEGLASWSDKISGIDYYGNDIGRWSSIGIVECKAKCESDPSCKGLGVSFDPEINKSSKGYCWIKRDMSTGYKQNSRWSYKLSR
jgi:hypothetical protein